VLISPFIKPGTTSDVYYNHYSWLRTMEDIFSVSAGHDHSKLPAGTVSGGLDGLGHIGYAAQPGLRAFGRDVFTNPAGYGQGGQGGHLTALTVPGTGSAGLSGSSGGSWATISLAVGAPLAAALAVGGYLWARRRGFALGRP
jgi:hypothetical protein